MERIITDIISLAGGCLLISFPKSIASWMIKQQNKWWGFHFGKNSLKITEVSCIIVGLAFIILSLLSLFNMIKYK